MLKKNMVGDRRRTEKAPGLTAYFMQKEISMKQHKFASIITSMVPKVHIFII